MEKIHILLSKKEWQELKDLKDKLGLTKIIAYSPNNICETYEDYLEEEKKKPTMALVG